MYLKRLPLAAALLFVLSFSVSAIAATYTVDNTGDSGANSLRDAITNANANAGPDTIFFAIAGVGPHVIEVATPLPDITEETIFNGMSQGGSSPNTLAVGSDAIMMIVIRPSVGSTATHALTFTETADNSIIRGLVIQGFPGAAMLLNGADSVTVVGNFLGTSADGTADVGNQSGVFGLNGADSTVIGTILPSDRNVISGNDNGGILLGDPDTTATIRNNYIGTNAAGTAAIANNGGIRLISTTFIEIGDETAGAGNVISGNVSAGIAVSSAATTTYIEGNRIGVSATGTALPNNGDGITVYRVGSLAPDFVRVGGATAPFFNTIAYNTGDGINTLAFVPMPQAVQIAGNSIFSNGNLGIDLDDDGVTANDVGDGDSGGNALQNHPVVTSAVFHSGTSNITINGTLASLPSSSFDLRFYQSTGCDPTNFGEGETYLGLSSVLTDASGDATFSVTFPGTAGGVVTATATNNATAGTSEFSACTIVTTAVTPTVTIDDPGTPETNAGTTTLTFTVTLSVASPVDVSLDYTTADGSAAILDNDYATASGTLTIPAGNTTGTIDVTVNGDVNIEPNETVLVSLSNPNGVTIGDDEGTGTIQNDDALPTVTITDVTQAEGTGGATLFDFTVTLSAPATFPSSIDWSTADNASDDSATAGSDYTADSGTINFAIGEQVKSITIGVNADAMFEPNEAFFVNFTNPSNVDLTDNQAIGTINNDDSEPTATIDDPSIVEGNFGSSNLTFTVTLSNPSQTVVNIFFNSADGTAETPSDYDPNSGSVTVPAGDLTATFALTIKGDTSIEPDETILIELTGATGATLLETQGIGTITNDDGLVTPSITISDPTVAEGDSLTTMLTYVVTLSSASASDVSVMWTTADGSATVADADYVPATNILTIPSGSTTGQIDVVVNGDTDIEGNDTVLVNLTTPVNATLDETQGVGTIANDDGLVTPGIFIEDLTLAEGDAGSTLFMLTITLSQASASDVSVTATTADDSAVAGPANDYQFQTNVVTIPSGSTSGTFTVAVHGDPNVEPDETFFVNLTSPVNGSIIDPQATATIQNDDGLTPPDVVISDPSVLEGNALATTLTFTVTLSGASASDVSVDWTTVDLSATVANNDYEAASGTLVIPAGALTGQIDVTVNGDTFVEPNESLRVDLGNPMNAILVDAQGAGTITNDDVAPGTTTLTIQKTAPATVSAGSNIAYTITMTNSGAIPATNVVVTDTIPVSTTFVSATPTQGSCSGTSTVTCTLGTIANGSSATITLVVQAPSFQANITNTASVDADQTSTAPDSSSASTAIAAPAATSIPTLSEWMLLALTMALATAAALKMRG